MKIILLVAGSGGGFYCETCLRDTDWARVMRARGHDIIVTPMYLPVNMEGVIGEGDTPVFFGGISLYLREQFPWLRHAPAWLTAWLDARWLLRLAARRAGATRADGLGSMTLSMLQGRNGHHTAELGRLAGWLAHEQPDAIVLSSTLLAGLAGPLRETLHVPVLAFAHDEDTWLDALDPPYDSRCWEAMRAAMADIAQVIAVSRTYASAMRQRLNLPPARVCAVYPGIDTTPYRQADVEHGPLVVGYLSRLTPSLGLETLVDALIHLQRQPGFSGIRLKAMGGQTDDDKAFIARLKQRLADAGMAGAAEFLPGIDQASRLAFLESLTVMSVPMPQGEAFGTFILEALASGVPVVLPAAGAFPEIVQATGGGITCAVGNAEALARALAELLGDRPKAAAIGRQGMQTVRRDFSVERMADALETVFAAALTPLQ